MLPHLAYMSMWLLLPMKIWGSQPLWRICSSRHLPSFKCCSTGTCIEKSHKGDRVCLHSTFFQCLLSPTPWDCICWNSLNALCPHPLFTCPRIMVFQVTILHPFEHIPSIVYAPTFDMYMSKRKITHKNIWLMAALCMTCSLIHLPSPSVTTLALKHMHWAHPQITRDHIVSGHLVDILCLHTQCSHTWHKCQQGHCQQTIRVHDS